MQAHKGGAHAVAVFCPGHAFGFVHVGNRKGQPWVTGQPHAQPGGLVRPARFQVIPMQAVQALQQLVEVVLVCLGEQPVG